MLCDRTVTSCERWMRCQWIPKAFWVPFNCIYCPYDPPFSSHYIRRQKICYYCIMTPAECASPPPTRVASETDNAHRELGRWSHRSEMTNSRVLENLYALHPVVYSVYVRIFWRSTHQWIRLTIQVYVLCSLYCHYMFRSLWIIIRWSYQFIWILEKITVAQLAHYRVHKSPPQNVRWIQYTHSQPISLRSDLILSCHL
jgi:hypothetical protein